MSSITSYSRTWQRKIEIIREEALISELFGYELVGVVCTPFVPYLTDPDALQEVAPGLRAVCSVLELESWLSRA